jgi:hypothetical protein
MNMQVETANPLSQTTPPGLGLTVRDRYHIQRSAALICEGEETHTLAAYLGVADDGHLYEKALTVTLNHLDQLVAIIEWLTGNDETGIGGR